MKVYRYENSEGYGPYHSTPEFLYVEDEALYGKMIDEHNWSDLYNHPGLRTLVGYTLSQKYKSATDSLKSLRKWFRKYNAMLLRSGFRVVSYEVAPEHVAGPDHVGQVAFRFSQSS